VVAVGMAFLVLEQLEAVIILNPGKNVLTVGATGDVLALLILVIDLQIKHLAGIKMVAIGLHVMIILPVPLIINVFKKLNL
jgi:hypothetical protein